MRPHGSPDELERRRKRAIALLEKGIKQVEVAQIVDVDGRSVRRWKAAHRKRGIAAIESKPIPGRPPKLAAKQHKQLERFLLKGAKKCGFPTDLWTCPRIAKHIRRYFGIVYHVDHVGKLLHAMGWSPQRPKRVAIERNEGEIQRWIKEEWPRIKKKRHD